VVDFILKQQDSLRPRFEKQKELSFNYLNKCKEEANKLVINKKYYTNSDDGLVHSRAFTHQWKDMKAIIDSTKHSTPTGYNIDKLKEICKLSVSHPKDFIPYKMLKSHIEKRLEHNNKVNWATAEALAFGSLIQQNFKVRLCGQDSKRGTFSQRHMALIDQFGNEIVPLHAINNNLTVISSNLSEEGVMAFEYGFSIDNPNNLTLWEAQ